MSVEVTAAAAEKEARVLRRRAMEEPINGPEVKKANTDSPAPSSSSLEAAECVKVEEISRPPSSSSEGTDDHSSSPVNIRRTRSSGPPPQNEEESTTIRTKRALRKRSTEHGFLKSTDSKSTQERPRTGEDFQALIPDGPSEQPSPDGYSEEQVETPMWIPSTEDKYVGQYCELARSCRLVSQDVALQHLMNNGYDVSKALQTFETLPVPESLNWSKNQLKFLVKRVVQGGRKTKPSELNKPIGLIIEKRFEILHQLCLGPSRWLCPAMRNRTEELPITIRSKCENCTNELFKKEPTTKPTSQVTLCNCCSLYAELYGTFRPFTTSVEADAFPYVNAPIPDYESDDEHVGCFTQAVLEDIRKPVTWSDDEIDICIKGFRRHGLNFSAIADTLQPKTSDHIEQFYVENRYRYNIDTLVSIYEKDRETPPMPKPRRNQEDRSPTPVDSGDEVDGDDSSTVRGTVRDPGLRATMTTRNKSRGNAIESAA